MLIGYARVSTRDQDPALQLDAQRPPAAKRSSRERRPYQPLHYAWAEDILAMRKREYITRYRWQRGLPTNPAQLDYRRQMARH